MLCKVFLRLSALVVHIASLYFSYDFMIIINELLATIQLPLRFPELIQNGLKRSGRVKIHQSLEKVKVKNLFSFFIGIML